MAPPPSTVQTSRTGCAAHWSGVLEFRNPTDRTAQFSIHISFISKHSAESSWVALWLVGTHGPTRSRPVGREHPFPVKAKKDKTRFMSSTATVLFLLFAVMCCTPQNDWQQRGEPPDLHTILTPYQRLVVARRSPTTALWCDAGTFRFILIQVHHSWVAREQPLATFKCELWTWNFYKEW